MIYMIIFHSNFYSCQYLELLLFFIDQSYADLTHKIINKVSSLLQNLQTKQCLYFILSQNTLNKIIVKSFFQIQSNEGIMSFISFIKSLVIRIDLSTIQCYYQPDSNNFPLMQCLLTYYNHSDDSMNRVNVRNSFLSILSIDTPILENHFIKLPTITYFSNLVCRLANLTFLLHEQISSGSKEAKITMEEIINEAGQINDIFNVGRKKVNFILMNCLFHYYIKPYILGSIVHANGSFPSHFALYMCNLLLKILNCELFINVLFTVMFFDKTFFAKKCSFTEPHDPFGFKFEYEFPYEKITFNDVILHNYSEEFVKSLINNQNVLLEELDMEDVNKMTFQISKQKKKIANDENSNQVLIDYTNSLIEKIIQKENIKKNHIKLSEVFGKGIGLCNNISDYVLAECSFMGNMYELYEEMFNQNKKMNWKFVRNYIKESLFESLGNRDNNRNIFLNKLYICILIYNCLNRNVSEVVMKKCNMFVISKVNLNKGNNESKLTNEQSEYDNYIYDNLYFANKDINKNTDQLNNEIVNMLLNILYIDPKTISQFAYPTIIYDIAIKLLYQFIGEQNSQTPLYSIFSKEIPSKYKDILKYLERTITKKPLGFVTFYKEWKQYNLYMSKNNNMFHCLFDLPEKYLHQYLTLDEHTDKNDVFKNYLHLYMIYHDILEKNEDNLIINKFPLFEFKNNILNKKMNVQSDEYLNLFKKEGVIICQENLTARSATLKKKGMMLIDGCMLYIANYERNEKECTFKELMFLLDVEFENDKKHLQLKLINDNEIQYVIKYNDAEKLESDYKNIEEKKLKEQKDIQDKYEIYFQSVFLRELNSKTKLII